MSDEPRGGTPRDPAGTPADPDAALVRDFFARERTAAPTLDADPARWQEILQVSAREKKTGLERRITIDNATSRYDREQLDEARQRIGALFGDQDQAASVGSGAVTDPPAPPFANASAPVKTPS